MDTGESPGKHPVHTGGDPSSWASRTSPEATANSTSGNAHHSNGNQWGSPGKRNSHQGESPESPNHAHVQADPLTCESIGSCDIVDPPITGSHKKGVSSTSGGNLRVSVSRALKQTLVRMSSGASQQRASEKMFETKKFSCCDSQSGDLEPLVNSEPAPNEPGLDNRTCPSAPRLLAALLLWCNWPT